MLRIEKDEVTLDHEVFSRHAVLEQMERLLESRHFRNSKRYPMLLRYVVEQTLAGKTEGLKERTLGMDVFARPGDYDTNADPIVRVTAGEVRKRLAQYYHEAGHESEIRIDLPLGAYMPHFIRPGLVTPSERVEEPAPTRLESPTAPAEAGLLGAEPADPVVVQPVVLPAKVRRPLLRLWLGVVLLLFAFGGGLLGWMFLRQGRAERATDFIWQPALSSANPFIIVIGVHSLDEMGQEKQVNTHAQSGGSQRRSDMLDMMVRSDMVPVSDIVSYSRVTDLLTRHNRRYVTMGSTDASIEQIRGGPLVLIGGLDNVWSMRLTSKLRYRFEEKLQTDNAIVDSLHPETVWRFNNMQDSAATTQDFAIVASYFDTTIDQSVLVVAGIGKAGTQVASEFLTSETWLGTWLAQNRPGKANRNVELVLSTEVVDGKAGPPRVVASSVW